MRAQCTNTVYSMEIKALHSIRMQYRIPVTNSLRHGRQSSLLVARTLEPCSSSTLALRAHWSRYRSGYVSVYRRGGRMRAFLGIQEPQVAWLDGNMFVIQSIGQQERTVPIPRWVAEKMLVERYKDMLSNMSDEDVAKLFEQQGVGLKEFPQGLVGDTNAQRSNSNIEKMKDKMIVAERRDAGVPPAASGDASPSPDASLSPSAIVRGGEEEDETAALLGERQDDRLVDGEEGVQFSALLRFVDSKDVALIAMGTGGLVLGTALMYMLISTLSGSAGSAESTSESSSRKIENKSDKKEEDAGEVQQRNGEETVMGIPDPYTMYTTGRSPDSEGGVIWERKEKPQATRDLWRVPMEDLRSPQSEDEPRQGEVVGGEQRDVRHAKRPPAFEDILDNAESISVGHKKSRSKPL